jgi:hypothetical protein
MYKDYFLNNIKKSTIFITVIFSSFLLAGSIYASSITTATNLTVTPGRLTYKGGEIVVSAIVKNASQCAFAVRPFFQNSIKEVICSSGRVSASILVPPNTATVNKNYIVGFSAISANFKSTNITKILIENAVPTTTTPPPTTTTTTPPPTTTTTTTTPPPTTTTIPVAGTITIGVSKHPDAIVQSGNDFWISSCAGNVLTEVSSTNKIVKVLNNKNYKFNCPISLASDGNHIWVANKIGNSITEFNATNGNFIRNITSKQVFSPIFIQVYGHGLWVINKSPVQNKSSIVEINIATGYLLKTIISPVGRPFYLTSPTSLAFYNNFIWVSNSGGSNVLELNSITNKYIKSITIGANIKSSSKSSCVIYSTGIIWTCGSGSYINGYNASSGLHTNSIKVQSLPEQVIVSGKIMVVYSNSPESINEYSMTGQFIKSIYRINNNDVGGYISVSSGYIWLANFNNSTVSKFQM